MKLSGLKSYLSNPSRAVFASLALSVITVLLLFVFKPLFPEKTAIYRSLSPVGCLDLEPGDSIEVRFKSFTDFDSYSVAIMPDSPVKTYDSDLKEISDGSYTLTIINSGDDVLSLALESPLVYKSIEQTNETGTIDLALYKKGSPNGLILAYVAMFTALFVFFVSFAFLTDNLTPSKFYLIGAITLGLGVYPILFPAWTAHDSDAHFQAAYRFSNILLGKGSGWTARECDVEFFRGSWKRFVFEGGYRPDPSSDIYLPAVLNKGMSVSGDQTAMITSDGGEYAYMLYYGIFNYLLLALGMALGRIIHLSPMAMINFARYLQGILFVILTWRAIKKVKSENAAYLLTLVSLFPMTLAYLTAFSYDGPVMMVVICCMSQLFRLKEDEEFWTGKNIIETLIWFFLLGSVKGGAYVIMFPMVFMLVAKPVKRKRNLLPFALIAMSFLALVVNNVLLKPQGEELFQLDGGEGAYSASFALYHPFRYLGMCVKTLLAFSGELITDSVGRSEGWNEAAIPGIIIVVILIGTYLCVLASGKVSKVTKQQSVSFITASVLLLLIAPVMMLHDTPIGYELIMGVQGRYFRPMAPLVVMLVAGICEAAAKKLDPESLEKITGKAGVIKNTGIILFALGSVASIFAMVSLYLGR